MGTATQPVKSRAAKLSKEIQQFPGEIRLLDIDVPELDPENARKHSKRNIEAVKESLTNYGQRKPIVIHVKTKVVIAGNGTLLAARQLGWKQIACVFTDLSKQKARGYGITDNRSSELAEWDYQNLAAHLRSLEKSGDRPPGWLDYEIGPLLAAKWEPPALINQDPSRLKLHRIDFSVKEWRTIARGLRRLRAEDETLVDEADSSVITQIVSLWLKQQR